MLFLIRRVEAFTAAKEMNVRGGERAPAGQRRVRERAALVSAFSIIQGVYPLLHKHLRTVEFASKTMGLIRDRFGGNMYTYA